MEKGERSEKMEVTDIAEELFDITSVHCAVRSLSLGRVAMQREITHRHRLRVGNILCLSSVTMFFHTRFCNNTPKNNNKFFFFLRKN